MSSTTGFGKYIKLIVYLVVIVLINIAGMTLFFRADLTSNDVFSISDASKHVVSTLSDPLVIKVFFTKDLPAPHNTTERYLHDLLDEYAANANKYFNYTFYDVSPEGEGNDENAAENQKLAREYGIYPVQVQVLEQDEVKFKKAYMGLVILHGDLIERIPTITSPDGLEYMLTTAIQKLNNKVSALQALKQKIKVKLVLSSTLKEIATVIRLPQLNDYAQKMQDVVDKVNRKLDGKLDYSYVDPVTDHNFDVSKYEAMSLNWPDIPDKNIKAGNGFIGFFMEYGDKLVDIPILKVVKLPIFGDQYNLVPVEQMEDIINENVESLININENLYYLADHGTLDPDATRTPTGRQNQSPLSGFTNLISRNYSLKKIDLEENPIPDSAKCLVIARPTEEFSDYDLFQIDQALMRGTNLAIFMDEFRELTMQGQNQFFNQSHYIPINTGLDKLLNHYGIRIKKAYVLDENCYKAQGQSQMGGGQQNLYFAPIIKNQNIDKELDFMKNIKGLVGLKMSPLELDQDIISKNKIKAIKLLSSSKDSWEMKGQINLNPMMMRPPKSDEEKGKIALAYLLEGDFPSYFAGKPIPEKPAPKKDEQKDGQKDQKKAENDTKNKAEENQDSQKAKNAADASKIETKGMVLEKSQKAKILLIASSEMIQNSLLNPYSDPQGKGPNAVFAMNLIDDLNGHDDIAVMRGKNQQFNPLQDVSGFSKRFVKSLNIAGLPVFVVLFGLFIWIRRMSRKKKIQMMFQKSEI